MSIWPTIWSKELNVVVVTADDFGLSQEVNEAVEEAHRKGVLTAASLMVAGPAVGHALTLVRRLPTLRLGMHLVLAEGLPALPAGEIPSLVTKAGQLRRGMGLLAFDLTLRPPVRRQIRKEISAQFTAFGKVGRPLDHVNAHKHFHLHPLVARDLFRIGARFGMKAIRCPLEPRVTLARAEDMASLPAPSLIAPWARLVRAAARRRGIRTADAVFGLRWSGQMGARRLRGLFRNLPAGLVEIYTHPAVSNDFAGHAVGYRYTEELAGLVAPEVVAAARSSGHRLAGYADAV
jgi:hopanoid biosynthesis associated protein HpnK